MNSGGMALQNIGTKPNQNGKSGGNLHSEGKKLNAHKQSTGGVVTMN